MADDKIQDEEKKAIKKAEIFVEKVKMITAAEGKLPGSMVFYFRTFRFVMWPTSTTLRQTYICVQKGCEARIERYKEQPSDDKFKIRLDKWPHTHNPDLKELHDTFAGKIKPMPTLPTAEKVELLNESFFVH